MFRKPQPWCAHVKWLNQTVWWAVTKKGETGGERAVTEPNSYAPRTHHTLL